MNKNLFYIVDVFAEKKYAGNQLAVFCQAGDFTDEEMQTLTQEMHFSESTFMLPHHYEGIQEVDLCCEQGVEIGRPSLLYLQGKIQDGSFLIRVGGKVKTIARGELM